MQNEGKTFEYPEKSWKLNFQIESQINQQQEDEEDEEEEKTEFVPVIETAQVLFEIQKVPEREGLFFVNFKRKAGAAMLYYGQAKLYCDAMQLYNNATLEDGETQ